MLNYTNHSTRYDDERTDELIADLVRKAESHKPTCCVPGCSQEAAYEVRLYDYYASLPPRSRTFNEQDETCPYLCADHQSENEREAVGIRQPRGYVQYPYTNQELAQGYTKYRKLRSSQWLGSSH